MKRYAPIGSIIARCPANKLKNRLFNEIGHILNGRAIGAALLSCDDFFTVENFMWRYFFA